MRKRLRGPLVGGEPQGERRKISFADFIIPLGAQKTFRRNRRGKGLALTVHAGNEKKIHGDFMFRAWGRKRVPGGGGTGKEKEEGRKHGAVRCANLSVETRLGSQQRRAAGKQPLLLKNRVACGRKVRAH